MKYISYLIAGGILFLMALALPLSTSAWEGFDWETWKEITKTQKPAIQTPQSGLAELLPLMKTEGIDSAPIDSIQTWEAKRDRILDTLRTLLGEPSNLEIPAPEAKILDIMDEGTYIRKRLRIRSESDDWIPAYLLLPKDLPPVPSPAMITLHQTVAQGKDETCGISGDPELAFARELAERGYICITPDVIGFGERTPEGAPPYHGAHDFFRKHPNWSFFGKMVWDAQRIVDYLETLPEVDSRRIGCIGHSHGAYGTIMCSIFEPRISAMIASCGFTTLRKDPSPNRWSHLTALMPRLGFFVNDIKEAPIDWHEIAACAAPRPYFNWATKNDRIFPETDNLASVFQEIKTIYALYGMSDRLSAHLALGAHSFPASARNQAYQWLDQQIPPRPDLNRYKTMPPSSKKAWETYREEIKNLLLYDIGPVDPPDLKIEYEVIASVEKENYIEKKISYLISPEESITAYLLLPDKSLTGRPRSIPGIVVFHQTTENGKEEPVGHAGRSSMHFGKELTQRGYIVLAPDSICAGERITASGAYDTRDFYKRFPTLSALGKMIQDGRRAVSILQAVPEVDPSRIGTIGHSLGAEESLFVAAFDARVKAAAASCGWAPFQAEKNPGRWARDHWFSYIPRLRIDLRAGRSPAWDFDDVIRRIAPRGYFNYQTREDKIFPEGAAAHPMTESARPVWTLYDAGANLRSVLESGGHDIPPSAREDVYGWFESILKSR